MRECFPFFRARKTIETRDNKTGKQCRVVHTLRFCFKIPGGLFHKIACWGISPIPIEQLRPRSWLRVPTGRFEAGAVCSSFPSCRENKKRMRAGPPDTQQLIPPFLSVRILCGLFGLFFLVRLRLVFLVAHQPGNIGPRHL